MNLIYSRYFRIFIGRSKLDYLFNFIYTQVYVVTINVTNLLTYNYSKTMISYSPKTHVVVDVIL